MKIRKQIIDINSLLCSLSLSFSDRMVALLDGLTRSVCATIVTHQIQQASACILADGCVYRLASTAAHELVKVVLIQFVDCRGFEPAMQEHITCRAEVAFDVHLSLKVVEKVILVAVDLITDDVKVDNYCLDSYHLAYRNFNCHTSGLFRLLLASFGEHVGLDSVQQVCVLVGLVTLVPVELRNLDFSSLLILSQGLRSLLPLLGLCEVKGLNVLIAFNL